MSFLLGKLLQSFQQNAFTLLIRFRDILYKLLILLLTSTVIVWLSIFLYGTFYYTYMPAVSHVKPVHLQFRWCDDARICSFPSANVSLVKRGQEQAMLRYKSSLHQTLSTLFFMPIFLTGSVEEKQLLSVELCDIYEEDPSRPAVNVVVLIHSKEIEVYSSQLRIYAHFTGLRYLMFHWPMLSAVIGVGTNLFFLSIVALMSWYRYLISQETHELVVRVGMDSSKTKTIDERRTQVKEFLMREKQRQTKMRASFSSFDVAQAQILPEESISRTQSLETLQMAATSSSEVSEPGLYPGSYLSVRRSGARSALSHSPAVTRAELSAPPRSLAESLRVTNDDGNEEVGSSDNNSSDQDSEGDILMVTSISRDEADAEPIVRKRQFLEEVPK